MLFNSLQFLGVFLPIALLAHWLVDRLWPSQRLAFLLVLSLVFYSYWDLRFLPLIGASIGINWFIARVFWRTRVAIVAAIVANIAVLGVFKYTGFLTRLLSPLFELPTSAVADLTLPLGISFFTFHHVMYLTDLRAGVAPQFGLVKYGLYIAFFPQVLAGPLVRWSEIMHQFNERPYLRSDAAERFGKGLILLVIGLGKKVLLGDPLAAIADPIFAAAVKGPVTISDAWIGTLAFTFQIYFDFSGYTDMALGIALMFGIVLPQNFNAPYRSASLQDFWRRWHMTLSRFLRDYLYIPLGGSRHGLAVTMFALLATMTIGGLWHGAGLTFVAWGVMHGLGLCIAILWRTTGLAFPAVLGWPLTFLWVVFAWVLFRAPSFGAALSVYAGLLGFADFGLFSKKWGLFITLAGMISIAGPIAWRWTETVRPSAIVALSTAVLAAACLLTIGSTGQKPFIYFQF